MHGSMPLRLYNYVANNYTLSYWTHTLCSSDDNYNGSFLCCDVQSPIPNPQ